VFGFPDRVARGFKGLCLFSKILPTWNSPSDTFRRERGRNAGNVLCIETEGNDVSQRIAIRRSVNDADMASDPLI